MSRSFRGDHRRFGNATNLRWSLGSVNGNRNGAELQHLDCVDRGQNKQFDFVTSALALYVPYHGQSTAGTAADDELPALPGDFLFYRERRVAELLSELLGEGLFLFAAINDDIVLAGAAVDADGAEREFVETHRRTPLSLASGAFRRDGTEGGPALLDFLAATVGA